MKNLKTVILLGCLCIPLMSKAMLVEDPAEWAKTLQVVRELQEQASQLKRQYDLIKEEYQQAMNTAENTKNIYNAQVGHSGFGNLLNSSNDLTNREWSPNTWDDALKGLAGGNPSRYQQLLQAYKTAHPVLAEQDYEKGASRTQYQLYQQQVATNQAAATNSTYAFNEIKQHLENIHQISEQIEQTQNTKAAIDLNARLLTEIAYIQVQELKMQALMNQQMAQEGADEIAGKTLEAKFNTLPN